MNTTVHCPFHGDIEDIEVPGYYVENGFKGQVRCNPKKGDSTARLRIEIVGGQVISVEQV